MSLFEIIELLISLGMLILAYLAYKNAKNN